MQVLDKKLILDVVYYAVLTGLSSFVFMPQALRPGLCYGALSALIEALKGQNITAQVVQAWVAQY